MNKKFLLVLCLTLFILFGIWFYFVIISELPSLEQLENPKPELATIVYSSDGKILDKFYIKNRTYITLNKIPDKLVKGLVATEDKNFYNHWGLHSFRIFKAFIKNIFHFSLTREGASTITQQLARNLYLSREISLTRKLKEAITAIQIERTFTKDEIIELYLNVAYFGRSAYGVSSASQMFFNKEAENLNLEESALLIGILKGPAYYDPYNHTQKAIERRNLVLKEMEEEEIISTEVCDSLKKIQIKIRSYEEINSKGIAPHFVEHIRQEMLKLQNEYGFDIYRDGLSIYTTLDSKMQKAANTSVEEHLGEYQKNFDSRFKLKNYKSILEKSIRKFAKETDEYRFAQDIDKEKIFNKLLNSKSFEDSVKKVLQTIEIGFVALDVRTGAIVSMVGGRNFKTFKYGLNHVTQIKRQAGSIFKPFVYLTAIDNGYPPNYLIENSSIELDDGTGEKWTPKNFEGEGDGSLMTLREGLKNSVNLVAVRTVIDGVAPIEQVIDYANKMGIKSTLPPYPSLALGSGDVSPMEMVSAFNVLPNKGMYVEPFSIVKITDKSGKIIYESKKNVKEVLSEETAFIITNMMEDVVNGGTGTRVRNFFNRPCAGKTGTTDDYADAWFVGFTPQISTVTWVGFDNKAIRFASSDGQGGRAAAPIFGKFAKYVYENKTLNLPLQYFSQPIGVIEKKICIASNRIASENCKKIYIEYFNEKYLPEQICNGE